jgi:DNA (cytosine-5)-methyltransferase 1
MTHAGLFSGIGGFSLAAQWMGWENVFDVEIDAWCRKVLHKNFPTTQLFSDVCTFNGLPFRGTIDVLSGGFPCQPWSSAGKQLGTEDPRHLWPQFLRVIREIQPRYVVGENVRGLLSWGQGIQFEAVCAELEAEGYDVLTFLLPAAGVGAPHHRDRLWFIAHRHGQGLPQRLQTGLARFSETNGALAGRESARALAAQAWAQFPTESPVYRRNDGIPQGLVPITHRGKQIKSHGNAIVPQVALQFFQAIEATS